jgi:hypothetical protein
MSASNYKTAKCFTTRLLLSHIRNCFIAELCVTVLDNLYSQQFYEQSWGVVL